jgi:predicted metal-binding membrane protein
MPGQHGIVTLAYFGTSFLMWFLMMIAMMVPAVIPVVMLFDRSRATAAPKSSRGTIAFVAGYLSVWVGYSIAASMLQIIVINNGIVDAMVVSRFSTWSAMLLIAAGLYQWLPLKARCLDYCRNPIVFLTQHYRPGVAGAWRTGVSHGIYCLGCCAPLMLLLFVFGSMNLLLIAALTLFITLEKWAPIGHPLRRTTGTVLIVVAAYILLR